MTPEGRVKKSVKEVLAEFEGSIYYAMLVPAGYGNTTLDFIGCIGGKFFAIETKKPGAAPSKWQEQIMALMVLGRGKVFVIDGTGKFDTTQDLRCWLAEQLS